MQIYRRLLYNKISNVRKCGIIPLANLDMRDLRVLKNAYEIEKKAIKDNIEDLDHIKSKIESMQSRVDEVFLKVPYINYDLIIKKFQDEQNKLESINGKLEYINKLNGEAFLQM